MNISIPARVLFVSFLLAGGLQAETLTFEDAFSRKDGGAGSPLDADNVGTSKAAWEATKNVVLAEGPGIEVTDQGAFVGHIALPDGVKKVTVEADIYPAIPDEPTNSKGWIGLGMGGADLGIPNFGGLLLLVYPNGTFSILFDPVTNDPSSAKAVVLKIGHITSWKPTGMNHLKLVYDKLSDTVSAFANEKEEVLASELSLKDGGHILETKFAGFSGFGQSSEVISVGGFALEVIR